MWLILWGLWAVFGHRRGKRTDGRRNSSQSGNGTGRGLPTVSPFVERGAAAVAVEAVGGGGLPRRTSQPRRRNNSAPRERFPPFVFPLPHLSGFIAHSQNNHGTNTIPAHFKSAAEYIYNLHARRIYNILHERAIIYIILHAHPRAPVPLFFFFLFFLIPFLLLSFLLSFLLYSFSFRLSFRFSSFPFLLFRFSFFLSSHFCNSSGGGKGLAFPHSSPLFPPCLSLFALSIIKRPGA